MNNIRICKKQQKEFIEWLEDEIQQQETLMAENQEKLYFLMYEDAKENLKLYSRKAYTRRIIFEEVLQKYKEIIGNDKIMKLELRENMYMRTIYGKIDKIFKLTESYVQGVSQKDSYFIYDKDNIIKVSYNIIDILEEGDYVNGCMIIKNTLKDGGNIVIVQGGNCYTNEDIKSVITHEQKEEMTYKVEKQR